MIKATINYNNGNKSEIKEFAHNGEIAEFMKLKADMIETMQLKTTHRITRKFLIEIEEDLIKGEDPIHAVNIECLLENSGLFDVRHWEIEVEDVMGE